MSTKSCIIIHSNGQNGNNTFYWNVIFFFNGVRRWCWRYWIAVNWIGSKFYNHYINFIRSCYDLWGYQRDGRKVRVPFFCGNIHRKMVLLPFVHPLSSFMNNCSFFLLEAYRYHSGEEIIIFYLHFPNKKMTIFSTLLTSTRF